MKHSSLPVVPEGLTPPPHGQNAPSQKRSEKFAGFTDDQVFAILERITMDAIVISGLCRAEAVRAGLSESATVFYAIDRMASVIGALADAPQGGQNAGSFTDWIFGDSFNQAEAESRGLLA
jgi:hypothetical protein